MSESRYISMTNTIVSTLSSSIGFIQLKLSDFDQKEIDFNDVVNFLLHDLHRYLLK